MAIQLAPISPTDGRAIVELFNHYVENSFAAFPEHPLPQAVFEQLLEEIGDWPTLTAKTPEGRLLGFAMLRPHNPFPTCAHVAEITYFVAPDCTGKGIGSRMLAELETRARKIGICIFLAAISAPNEGSLAFHRKHGFVEVGRLREVCIKRGTPFDVVWMQKML